MNRISPHAVVQTEDLGKDISIGEFSVIRSNVRIGDGVTIHPHVVVNEGVVLEGGVEVFPGALVGKEPKGAGALARKVQFNKHVIVGSGTSIGPHAVIFYDVEIGQNTLIGDGASIREGCRVGSFCIISRYVTLNYNTLVGDRVKIMDLSHVTGNSVVGDDVFISACVAMANDNAIGRAGYSTDHVKGPIIEEGSAVGLGAILLPGVRIGSEAIVGAGSVVTKDVSPRTLVAGIPARLVRTLQTAT